MVYSEHGEPGDVLKIHSYKLPDPAPDEFLVRFLACPINPADLNQIEGVYPKKPAFTDKFSTDRPTAVGGNEGLVEVIKAGKNGMSMKWNLGEWAIMNRTTFGTWRTHALAKESDLLKVSCSGVNPIDVATVSINPCTAYRMLQDFAKLSAGDWFIQNGANSAVGKSAIQMGKIWGFKSVNIIRDRTGWESTRDELIRLGADCVITDTQVADKEFMRDLFRHGNKDDKDDNVGGSSDSSTGIADIKHPKLALNCVGGAATMNMCRALAQGAHIVTYGAMARQPIKVAASSLIFKDFHFHGFWVSPWNDAHPEQRREMLDEVLGWMRDGRFKSPEVDVNTWTLEQTLQESQDVFMRALHDKSKKQVLAIHY